MRKNLEALGLGLLFFVIALLCLWLALTLGKPLMDFSADCERAGGVVVRGMQCVSTIDLPQR